MKAPSHSGSGRNHAYCSRMSQLQKLRHTELEVAAQTVDWEKHMMNQDVVVTMDIALRPAITVPVSLLSG
jgi:hypothetical protein